MDRRKRKKEAIREELDTEHETQQTYFGPDEADYGILTWGSSQGAVKEAVDRLNDQGHSVKALSVSDMAPYPVEEVTEWLESVDEAMVVEMNASAQFRGLTQKELGRFGDKLTSLLKYNGNPFEPAEVVEGFEANVNGGSTEDLQAQVRFEPAAGD
jgi:pyruvate ferredoxin oxidoreductase alpha subunit